MIEILLIDVRFVVLLGKVWLLFGLHELSCKVFGILSIIMWEIMIRSIFVMYQRNQRSMYLKYDVFGKVLLIDPSSDERTNNEVTAPMNLLLKFSTLIYKVE